MGIGNILCNPSATFAAIAAETRTFKIHSCNFIYFIKISSIISRLRERWMMELLPSVPYYFSLFCITNVEWSHVDSNNSEAKCKFCVSRIHNLEYFKNNENDA